MLFWGYNFISLKFIYQVMEPGSVLFWRYFVMWVALVLLCLATKQSLHVPKQHRWRIYLAGFNSMGIYMILFMEGVKLSSASESAIILSTVPIMVAISAMALKYEKYEPVKLAGGLVALVGVGIIILGKPHVNAGSNPLLGDFLLFLSAISWTVSVILAKPASKDMHPLPMFTMSMLGGLPLVVGYGIGPALATDWSKFEPMHWANFTQIAFGSGGIAMVCYYKGISQLPASAVAIHQFFVPVIATIFGAWLLHERMVWMQGVGAVIMLVGIFFAVRSRKVVLSSDQAIPEVPV